MKKDIIEAILDGKTVQFNRYSTDTKWYDLGGVDDDPRLYASLFVNEGVYTNYVWRIKP